MRVLIVPELYRPDDATANGTLNDAVELVDSWLDVDPDLHVYWLLAPPETADYDPEYVHADRERVTLLEADPFMHGHEHGDAFSETGYTEEQLRAVERGIYDESSYVDVVVDQRVTGRYDLYKWLHRLGGGRDATVPPVSLVGYVHDLRLPFKRHGREVPNDAPTKVELSMATFVDGLWFKAGVDADRMREYGRSYFDADFLDDLLDDALETGSPLDFSRFEERYADVPRTLHVAGSGWGKKNLDVVLDVAETLFERYEIRTLMTNMDPIPDAMADRAFVDPVPNCSRERYEAALRTGDLAICASDHETMARTPFEQAASGQVLLVRDEPWIYDCVPEDYRLAGGLDDLETLACRAVEHWDEAVAANRKMVEYVTNVRDPANCGRRTYEDLQSRVDSRLAAFEERVAAGETQNSDGESVVQSVERALDERALAGLTETKTEATDTVSLADLAAATDRPRADLVHALRSLGYRDVGNAGTPEFVRSG